MQYAIHTTKYFDHFYIYMSVINLSNDALARMDNHNFFTEDLNDDRDFNRDSIVNYMLRPTCYFASLVCVLSM